MENIDVYNSIIEQTLFSEIGLKKFKKLAYWLVTMFPFEVTIDKIGKNYIVLKDSIDYNSFRYLFKDLKYVEDVIYHEETKEIILIFKVGLLR